MDEPVPGGQDLQPRRSVRRRPAPALLIAVVATLAVLGYYLGYLLITRTAPRVSQAVDRQAPAALSAATVAPTPLPSAGLDSTAPEPAPAGVQRALSVAFRNPDLGGRLVADVADAVTGSALAQQDPTGTAAPASTAKLLTAAAVLTVHRGTDRIVTRVETDANPGELVLVGSGDPTLTGAAPGQPGAYPDAARMSALAAQVTARHIQVSRILVDDSLFTGPSVSPNWGAGDAPSDYAAPITAAMVDGGRNQPGDEVRSGQPDLAAGQALARLLGIADSAVSIGTAPAGASVVGHVASATYAELVDQMLQNSDNVIAECLARQVAIATHATVSFTGAAAAIRQVLQRDAVDVGTGMSDGSGLAVSDRLSPATLIAVLRLITGPDHPALHAIVTALPVAGWSGTLADRFAIGSGTAAGAGAVRAKTGTLSNVSALAGLAYDRAGRLLVFALIADQVVPGGTLGAEAALDQIAADLSRCGCS
jgi:D-alanyl-D-alanine carboxypeptidase/D-alanyl-D-alanine-endopeptidase (penicillin-binding protein 4)